nr:insulin-degrading enzyme-like 1, peroxisomal [Tanacetum cinerariifolium]
MYLKTIPSEGRIETGRVWMIKDGSNSEVIGRATRSLKIQYMACSRTCTKQVFEHFIEKTPWSLSFGYYHFFLGGSILKDFEFRRLQERDMLWTGPISNASVEAVECEISIEFRAISVHNTIYCEGSKHTKSRVHPLMFELILYEMPEDEFKSNITAPIEMNLEKHKNLREESAYYW